jgi:hypothetical protein
MEFQISIDNPNKIEAGIREKYIKALFLGRPRAFLLSISSVVTGAPCKAAAALPTITASRRASCKSSGTKKKPPSSPMEVRRSFQQIKRF